MSPTPKFPKPRNYKWADATPGNSLATKHGAHESNEKIDADSRAAEIERGLLTRYPWLADPAFEDARTALRRVNVRIARAEEWLDVHGDWDQDGKVRDVARLLTQLERLARDLRNDVGGAPVAAARLVSIARGQIDVAAELEQGRALRLAYERRETAQEASDGDSDSEGVR